MHQIATVTDDESEPKAPDELAELRSELRVLKATVLTLRDRLKAVEAFPPYMAHLLQEKQAAAAAEAARREADRRGWLRARVADLLAGGFLQYGDAMGEGSKLTEAGDLVRHGRNSTGGWYEVEEPPASDLERARRRRRFWTETLARAEAWHEYKAILDGARDIRGWRLDLPREKPALTPSNLKDLGNADVIALCHAKLAELPNPDAAAEEARRVELELLHRGMQLYG
jgi:hypothetical protein